MIELIKQKVLHRNYEPLNKILLFKENFEHNYKYLSSINPNVKIAPVLKSNAYGHGIKQIGPMMDSFGPPFLAVDSIYEAYELEKAGVKSPILIMGYVDPENLRFKKLPFMYSVFSMEYAEMIHKYQPSAKLHVFVDTGMNREGIRIDEFDVFVKKIETSPIKLNIAGLMSHFADADSEDITFTKMQVQNFNRAVKVLENSKVKLEFKHIAASFGTLKLNELKELDCNIARTGLAIYGYGDDNLKPALRLTTKIAQVKKVLQGEQIGYNGTFTAPADIHIGILPIGYANGIDRRLSNKGVITITKQQCRILGRVSMNITTIDISNLKQIENQSTNVVVISEDPQAINSLENISKICETISYELLIHLDPSIRREFA